MGGKKPIIIIINYSFFKVLFSNHASSNIHIFFLSDVIIIKNIMLEKIKYISLIRGKVFIEKL